MKYSTGKRTTDLLAILLVAVLGVCCGGEESVIKAGAGGKAPTKPSTESAEADKASLPAVQPISAEIDWWLRDVSSRTMKRESAARQTQEERDHSGILGRLHVGVVVDCHSMELKFRSGDGASLRQFEAWLNSQVRDGRLGSLVIQGEPIAVAPDTLATLGAEDQPLEALRTGGICEGKHPPTLDVVLSRTRQSLPEDAPRLLVVVTDRLQTSPSPDPLGVLAPNSRVVAAWFAAMETYRQELEEHAPSDTWLDYKFGYRDEWKYGGERRGKPEKPPLDEIELKAQCPGTEYNAKYDHYRYEPAFESWRYWFRGQRPLAVFYLLERGAQATLSPTILAEVEGTLPHLVAPESIGEPEWARGAPMVVPGLLLFRLFPVTPQTPQCRIELARGDEGLPGHVVVSNEDTTCRITCRASTGMASSALKVTTDDGCSDGLVYRESPAGTPLPCGANNGPAVEVTLDGAAQAVSLPGEASPPPGITSATDGSVRVDCAAYRRWLCENPSQATTWRVSLATESPLARSPSLPRQVEDVFSAAPELGGDRPCRIAGLEAYLERILRAWYTDPERGGVPTGWKVQPSLEIRFDDDRLSCP